MQGRSRARRCGRAGGVAVLQRCALVACSAISFKHSLSCGTEKARRACCVASLSLNFFSMKKWVKVGWAVLFIQASADRTWVRAMPEEQLLAHADVSYLNCGRRANRRRACPADSALKLVHMLQRRPIPFSAALTQQQRGAGSRF